jgi:hypothetical protein
MTRNFTCRRTGSAQHNTLQQPTPVTELTRKLEGHGHKVYTDSFFSSPDLFGDLSKKKCNCFRAVRPNREGMPHDLQHKKMKLEWGDMKVRTTCDLTAICRMNKTDIYKLMNVHEAPTESNFCHEKWDTIKPLTLTDDNHHMGSVDQTK